MVDQNSLAVQVVIRPRQENDPTGIPPAVSIYTYWPPCFQMSHCDAMESDLLERCVPLPLPQWPLH